MTTQGLRPEIRQVLVRSVVVREGYSWKSTLFRVSLAR
jgi:hypothetical protein